MPPSAAATIRSADSAGTASTTGRSADAAVGGGDDQDDGVGRQHRGLPVLADENDGHVHSRAQQVDDRRVGGPDRHRHPARPGRRTCGVDQPDIGDDSRRAAPGRQGPDR